MSIITLVGSFAIWSCVDTWSGNQLLHLFWMDDFAALLTDKSKGWNLLVRLWVAITTLQLFSPQNSLKISLCCPLKVPIIIKEYLTRNLCHVWNFLKREKLSFWKTPQIPLRAMTFCERCQKRGKKIKLWEALFGFTWTN